VGFFSAGKLVGNGGSLLLTKGVWEKRGKEEEDTKESVNGWLTLCT
jgi:hypothetical protein